MSIGKLLVGTKATKNEKQEENKNDLYITKYEPGDVLKVEIQEIREYGAIAKVLEAVYSLNESTTSEYDFSDEFGLIHISEIKNGYVKNINDYLKPGDIHFAQVISEPRGRLNMSLVHNYFGYDSGLSRKYDSDILSAIKDAKSSLNNLFDKLESHYKE